MGMEQAAQAIGEQQRAAVAAAKQQAQPILDALADTSLDQRIQQLQQEAGECQRRYGLALQLGLSDLNIPNLLTQTSAALAHLPGDRDSLRAQIRHCTYEQVVAGLPASWPAGWASIRANLGYVAACVKEMQTYLKALDRAADQRQDLADLRPATPAPAFVRRPVPADEPLQVETEFQP